MIIETTKYLNQKLSFFGEIVHFKGAKAEVSENLGKMILDSKFPYVFPEGNATKEKTPIEKMLMDELSDKEKVMGAEIERLNKIIESKDTEISRLKAEVQLWKNEVDKVKARANSVLTEGIAGDAPAEVEKSTDDDIKAQLESMTKDELLDMAERMNLNVNQAMKKAVLIDLLIKESEK